MALTDKYLVTTRNLESIINSIINARAPERFTNKFLEDLGFKSTNDRLYIGVFKSIGLLDDSGVPTDRYYEFLDQSETYKILAVGIREAYEDLFNLRKDAQNLSQEEVKNKLKTLTQGQKGEKVIDLMAKTFCDLSNLADWSVSELKQQNEKENQNENEHQQEPKVETPVQMLKNKENMNLHYNIQIHLPETSNMAVYDAIFQSLKKHLL